MTQVAQEMVAGLIDGLAGKLDRTAGGTVNGPLTVNALISASGADLTLVGDTATATGTRHRIDTEAAAAADDLVTMNGGVEGQMLILSAVSSARVVFIRSTGNFALLQGDIALNRGPNAFAWFVYSAAALKWMEVSRPASRLGTTLYNLDGSPTINAATARTKYRMGGALTQSRTAVLQAAGFVAGDVQSVLNVTTGGFSVPVRNLTAGGTILATLTAGKEAFFSFDGTNWLLDYVTP